MASRDVNAIKAGVNGMMDDAPSPETFAPTPSASITPSIQDTIPTASAPGLNEEYEGVATNIEAPTTFEDDGFNPGEGRGGKFDTSSTDKIHEIAEAIINEKWQELLSSVGNIAVWKEKVDTNILSMKQEIVRINDRFDNLQNAVLGKVKEYDVDMKNVNTEMKALEKVFERIIEPLTSNVKELNRITKELKDMK